MHDSTLRARNLLARARRIVVLTGAGVSQESGVPTFRGAEGLWRSFRPEELATPEAFRRDPRLVWEWYGWRRRRIAPCRPNAAHEALARLAATRDGVTLVTQNVDGLHERAALAAREAAPGGGRGAPVLALHGSLFRTRCTRCDYRREEPREALPPGEAGSEAPPPEAAPVGDAPGDGAELPTCPRCGALLRPDVVWFGESLDPAVLDAAWRAAGEADVCLVVGTSGVVHPAASLAAVTREGGGSVIEVNPEPTPLTALAAVSLRASAVAAVPAILRDIVTPEPEPTDAR
ncbi:MAG TPA: NAD-dependent deacylase [Gemmatimonadaceae bacterium]|nr:NAD-dependent deacylase [Gemmatimonadaceae bacterium]